MIVDLLRLAGGGAALYFGAEWLVRGASGLARTFGVRPLVVGLTVVAFGTSAPELVVTLLAALEGKSAIALGNVIGSNIANLGLILGVTALINPPQVEGSLIRREAPVLVASALSVPVVLFNGLVSRLEGLLLVASAVAFTLWLLSSAQKVVPPSEEPVQRGDSRLKLTVFTLLGLGTLVAGGKVFVDGASALALALGMSERVVGLTIVAIGTSLPELATSLIAALRGHSAIAIGNVVGSNIYNVLLILGFSSAVAPMAASLGEMRLDVAVMLVMTLGAAILFRGARLVNRIEGGVLLTAYAAFLAVLVLG